MEMILLYPPPLLLQGEYVAVERIEGILRDSSFVAQAFVHGEPGGRHLMALIVPRFQKLLDWAAQLPEGSPTSTASVAGSVSQSRSSSGNELGASHLASPTEQLDLNVGGMQHPLSAAQMARLATVCALPSARKEVLEDMQQVSKKAGLAGFEYVHAGQSCVR